jgi:hypothetical protein
MLRILRALDIPGLKASFERGSEFETRGESDTYSKEFLRGFVSVFLINKEGITHEKMVVFSSDLGGHFSPGSSAICWKPTGA